jgi:hypothetical protein
MKRLALGIVVIGTLAAIPLTTGIANATPTNTTSITLTCDKNVDATVSLTLQPSQSDTTFLGSSTISCGPTSNVGRARNHVDIQTGTARPDWVVINTWTNSTGAAATGCPTGGTLPDKTTCTNSSGLGSQLVVR